MSTDIENYFKSIPVERSERFTIFHSLIIELYPGIVMEISHKMLTYRFGEGWVALANQKNYISLYTCGYHHIDLFKQKNPGVKTGRGCINFKDKDYLPIEDIKQVIKHAIEHPKLEP